MNYLPVIPPSPSATSAMNRFSSRDELAQTGGAAVFAGRRWRCLLAPSP